MKKVSSFNKVIAVGLIAVAVLSIVNTALIVNLSNKLEGINTWTYRLVPLVYNNADATVKAIDCQNGNNDSCASLKTAAANLRDQAKSSLSKSPQ